MFGFRSAYIVFAFLLFMSLFVSCGAGGGGSSDSSGSGGTAPVISNLSYSPASVIKDFGDGAISISGTVGFVDADGDISTITIADSGSSTGTDASISGASGVTAGTLDVATSYFTSTAGSFPFDVWITDAAGNKSNVLTGSFLVSAWVSATAPRKVPDTGQATSYTATFGEDADYTVNSPSYTDNGDGTITDDVTGLMWQKCSAGQTNDASCSGTATTHNWYQATGTPDATYNPSGATNVCGSLSLAGKTDWRLPK